MIESSLNGKKILVVDDEMQLRQALIFDLNRRGCQTYEAANGSEAYEIFKANKIDIVISDVRMPNGDGIFLLKEIRKVHSSIPIVLLATGFADLTEKEALEMGAYGLIEKPINRKMMLGLLEQSTSLLGES